MKPLEYVLFGIAVVFYLRAWKYIRTLVTEVNRDCPDEQFTTLRWTKHRFEAWRLHSRVYPSSPIRKQIVLSMSLTILFMIAVMLVQIAAGKSPFQQ
jgi:hypothetical protein